MSIKKVKYGGPNDDLIAVYLADEATGSAIGGNGALTNRSGAITAGGTQQSAAAENTARRYLLAQNPVSASESFWLNFDGTNAVVGSPSIEVAPGVTLTWEGSFVPSGAISVIAATTGTAFTIKEA